MTKFSDERILQALRPYRVQPSALMCTQIRWYAEKLLLWNRKVNLTSITEPGEILRRHFGESFFGANFLPAQGTLVDIGSGAGFPGLALKIVCPNLSIVLVEPNKRKVAFLNEVCRGIQLKDVKVLPKRIEDVAAVEIPTVDVVTARAVGSYDDLMNWSLRSGAGALALWLGSKEAADVSADARFKWERIPIPGANESFLVIGKPA